MQGKMPRKKTHAKKKVMKKKIHAEGRSNSWISHDVTAAMLVSPNNEMAAMLVSRSNPPGIESYYYVFLTSSFVFIEKHGC